MGDVDDRFTGQALCQAQEHTDTQIGHGRDDLGFELEPVGGSMMLSAPGVVPGVAAGLVARPQRPAKHPSAKAKPPGGLPPGGSVRKARRAGLVPPRGR